MGEIAKLANLPDLLSMFVDFDVSSIRELLPLVQKALNSEVHLDVIVDRWESIAQCYKKILKLRNLQMCSFAPSCLQYIPMLSWLEFMFK